MSTIVDFGDELGQVDFGDMSLEDLRSNREMVMTVRQRLIARRQQANEAATYQEAIPTVTTREAAESGVAAARESGQTMGGRFISALGRYLASAPIPSDPLERSSAVPIENARRASLTPKERAAEQEASLLNQYGKEIVQQAQEQPVLPGTRESVYGKVMSGIGSTAPTALAGLLGPVAGPVVGGLAYGASASEAAYQEAGDVMDQRIQEAAARGDDAEARRLAEDKINQQNNAALLNLPIGALTEGALGVAGQIPKIAARAAAPAARGFLRTLAKDVGTGYAREFFQEGSEKGLGNVAASFTYDPDRPLTEGVVEDALVGGGTGGILSGAGSLGGAAGRYGDRVRASGMSELELARKRLAASALDQEFRNAELQGSAAQEAGLNIAVQSRQAFSQIDAQLAQTPVQTPAEAQVVFARGLAEKLRITTDYLRATQQAGAAQQEAEVRKAQVGEAAQALQAEEAVQQAASPLAQQGVPATEPTPQGAPPITSYGVMLSGRSEGDRVFVSVPVNGVPMLFYRSSKGTSGKRAGSWYPAFGIAAGDWIVKGRVPDMERGYDLPEVKAVMDALNANLSGTVEETVATLAPSLGNPVGARQIASLTYGPRGIDRKVGQDAEGMIDNFTGVSQRIREVLNAVMEARPQQPQSPAVTPAIALSELEQAQASRFPAAPMAQAQEPAPTLLSPDIAARLRAARQQDLLQQADVQAASTLPETVTTTSPVDEAILNRPQPTPQDVQVQVADAGVLRPEEVQPQVQVELPGVGQQDAQVNPPREEVKPLGKRKSQQLAWLEDPLISEAVAGLSPEEKARVQDEVAIETRPPEIDEETGEPIPTPPRDPLVAPEAAGKQSWKTEVMRFIRESRAFIAAGAGGRAGDIANDQRFDPIVDQVHDAIMRDMVRNFEKDGGRDGWNFAFAWKRAFKPIRGRSVITRTMNVVRATEKYKDLKSQVAAEIQTDEGDTVSVADRSGAAPGAAFGAKPELKSAAPLAEQSSSINERLRSAGATPSQIRLATLRALREFAPNSFEQVAANLDEDLLEDPKVVALFEKEKAAFQKLMASRKDVTVAMPKAEVEAALREAFGEIPPSVTVIEDPAHVLPNGESGQNVGAYVVLPTGKITANAAYIDTPMRAVEAVVEEGIHIVWPDPALKAAKDAVLAEVTEAEVAAKVEQGYAPEVAREEAAVEKILDYLRANSTGGTIGKFIEKLWSRLKEVFGLSSKLDKAKNQILQRALEVLRQSTSVTTQQDAEYMAAVERGDMATAQRMVNEAAKRAGYTVGPVYHGTTRKKVTRISPEKGVEIPGAAFFTDNRDMAEEYTLPREYGETIYEDEDGNEIEPGNVVDVYLRMRNPLTVDMRGGVGDTVEMSRAVRSAKASGRDGVVFLNVKDGMADSANEGASFAIFSGADAKSAQPVTRDSTGSIIPLSRRFDASSPDIRQSKSTGFFLNTEQAGQAIASAQAAGADAQTLASIAQAQGSLVPRTSLDEANALAQGSVSNRIAFSLLKGLRKIAELGDRGWLSQFPLSNPNATTASDMAEAKELAAEAVVRSDLGLRKLRESLTSKLEAKKEAMAAALQEIPTALQSKLDAELAKAQADNLVRDMQRFLADQIKLARTTSDAATEQLILQASRTLSEARRSIGSAVGTALTAIAKEMPRSITGEAAMLKWLNDRIADKSQPPIMSDLALQFLTTRMAGTRTAPITRINLSQLVERIREIQDEKGQAQQQMAQFQKEFGGKAVTAKRFASKYGEILSKYSAAISVYKEISSRIRSLDNQVTALNKAIEVMDRAMKDTGYDLRLKDAVKLINASPAEMKIVYGVDGKPTGTITVPDPITKKAVTIDLTPGVTKVKESVNKLRDLAAAHEIAIADPETDPYVVEQLQRNLTQIQRLSEGLAPWLLRSVIPEKVPFLGGRSFPSLWELKAALPWFGNRLSTPNNILGWIGGPLQRSQAALVEAFDVAELALENLRSDPDLKKPSQERINLTMLKAMQAHDLDPANPEHQREWGRFISRIISQNQNAESVPFKVGDSTIYGMKVLPEDMEAAEAQKAYSKAVFQIGQKSPKGSIMRNLFERPLLQAEEIAGKVILRASADYGLKMSRTASLDQLPIVRSWVKASSVEEKLKLIEENFEDIILGTISESNPEFASPFSAQDQAIFREAVALERQGPMPFTDLDGFLDWWAQRRAELNETTEAEERVNVEADLLRALDQMMTAYGDNYAAGKVGEKELSDMNQRNIVPPTIITALSSDNQFTRPRGALLLPSSFYQYDLSGVGKQETFKTNLLNHLAAEQLLGWKNLLAAIRQAMEKYDKRKNEMVRKGMSESSAIRKIQSESRRTARSVANETDYATLRHLATSIEAMNAELERMATEYISVPEDMPFIRSIKAVLALLSSSLLSATSPIVNNGSGAAFLSAVVASWMRRTSMTAMLVSAPKTLLKMLGYSIGRGLSSVAKRVKWFDQWMRSNSGIGGVIGKLMINSMIARNNAINAITINVPDVANRVRMINALPGSNGYMEPGKYQHAFTAFVNWAQSGFGIQLLKKVTPQWAHPMIDRIAKAPLYVQEQIKARFPGSVDRVANITLGSEGRNQINDPGLLQAIHDAFARREAAGPGWDSLATNLTPEELGIPLSASKFIRDMLSATVPFERAALDWYKRTKAMDPATRLNTPLLPQDQEDQFILNELKLANQRTQSTTPPVLKGKGQSGLYRSVLGQFARYGINMAGVMGRRFALVQGDDGEAERYVAGLVLAFTLAVLSAFGVELKQLLNSLQGEPRNALTLSAATEDPAAAGRYMSAAIASQIPWGGEMLQQMFGGSPPTQPFDVTRNVPLLGFANATYNMAKKMLETGDVVFPAADFVRATVPLSKIAVNAMLPGDLERREAARAVRLNAPTDIELREFSGTGSRATPMQPLIRSALNAAMAGDEAGYQEAFDKAVAYQVGRGKTQQEAVRSVNSAIAAKDPISSVVGRQLSDADVERITANMSGSQKRSFLRARAITSRTRQSRGLLRGRRRGVLRGQRRKKAKRSGLLKSLR